jgi:signal peptidase I
MYILFPKMEIDSWKAWVPVLNIMELSEKVGRSRWYGLLFLVPIVAFFIVAGTAVAAVRSFNRFSLAEAALAVIYPPISFYRLAVDKNAKYEGPILKREAEYLGQMREAKMAGHERKLKRLIDKNPYAKSGLREWFESIVFAVFAAAFIRMFLIEAYVIPTPSMEGSLLVGDFLFVSKSAYGMRMPQTVAMVPLLHNRVPVLGTESYFKKPSLPYYRLKPLSKIKRNGPIVFNWPVGDSVYITSKRSYTVGQVKREPGFLSYDPGLAKKVADNDFVVRPMDKKDHYIKRCVAIPGDSLQIRNGQIFINGSPSENPQELQFQYLLVGGRTSINPRRLEQWGITNSDAWSVGNQFGFFLNERQVGLLQEADPNLQLLKLPNPPDPVKLFPHDPSHFPSWSVDNYGPVWIPKKGETITISPENLALYQRVISVYEDNELEIRNGVIYINGEQTDSYTFKQDYYWAMGDNRHNSEDSRMWGFVPHDHIVGKPLFIWFSTKNGSITNGIRWNRLFKSAKNI